MDRFPNAVLTKNGVGNLSVYVDDEWVGYIDLQTAELYDDAVVEETNPQ